MRIIGLDIMPLAKNDPDEKQKPDDSSYICIKAPDMSQATPDQ